MDRISLDKDIERTVAVLRGTGTKKCILFGSCVTDPENARDIDVALTEVPRGMFFRLMGRLIKELKNPVDVVDLDTADEYFRKRIIESGRVLYESED